MNASSRMIVAGLGNPGQKYAGTRHNVGFMVIDMLADRFAISFQKKKISGAEYEQAETVSGDARLMLIKPLTFMNRSGIVVASVASYFRVIPERVLIVHDDLDLSMGRVKFSAGGGAGGHNGIRSVISHMGTRDFCRLKAGIGRPVGKIPVDRYVLSCFDAIDASVLEDMLSKAVEGVECWAEHGIDVAMNQFNRR